MSDVYNCVDAPTCTLRYAVLTALGGVITIDRPVPLCTTLDEFVRVVQNTLIKQDCISPSLVLREAVPTNMLTEGGVPLSDLRDFFELMPCSVISIADKPRACTTLARCHVAWRVKLEEDLTCVVWARMHSTLKQCKAALFQELCAIGIVHSDTNVPLSLISTDGFRTPLVSPRQMSCGTIYVPGKFTPAPVPAVTMDHPDVSDYEFGGVFDTFWNPRTMRNVVDRSRWV